MTPEEKEHKRLTQKLAGLAIDYVAHVKDTDVADLNRMLGYCEAVLDLIIDPPPEV